MDFGRIVEYRLFSFRTPAWGLSFFWKHAILEDCAAIFDDLRGKDAGWSGLYQSFMLNIVGTLGALDSC